MNPREAARAAYCYRGGRAAAADAPGLLFLHGAAHDHSVWGLQSRYFAHHGWNVLVPDLPGHGRSPGEAFESIEALAEFGRALLECHGVERAALVGHSMGSLVALEMAPALGDRAIALALLGTAAPMAVSEGLLAASRADSHEACEMINVWAHASPFGTNSIPGTWISGVNMRLMERARPGVLHRDLSACAAYGGALARAASVVCPALVLSGARDQMTPPKAAVALSKAFPKGAIRTSLPGCGHALMAEEPGLVLDALREFLGRA